ncbi:TraX family protein [Sulfurirhabdus autotrophica]|uniref:TraX protein n=1 Tax=Sulfurirhabdus autotrophica TaxID=1706046 RepID=A0A4R3XU25_9PROT|nr:TraX family protein [Sulfurirhabdus autotrophica]TCV82726.1 TraX protein [Sulfurirhabdus autotrophica]
MTTARPPIQGVTTLPARSVLPRLAVSSGTLEALKWMGLVLMTLDHINKHLFDAKLPGVFEAGRICMPIFGFVLAYNLARPGAMLRGTHLHAMKRLAIFGTIATPFIAGLGGLVSGWWPLNIMFTLLVATGTIYLIEKGGIAHLVAAALLSFFGGMFVEFWWNALTFCLAAWWYCKTPNWSALLMGLVATASLFFINGNFWAFAALPFIFMAPHFKLNVPRIRYVFYIYYPAHLAILFLIKK